MAVSAQAFLIMALYKFYLSIVLLYCVVAI